MPALNYDYDYYEYEYRKKRASTKNNVPAKNNVNKSSYAKGYPTKSTSKRTNNINTSNNGAKNTQRNRNINTNRKKNNGIDVNINIQSKATKIANKPKEMTLKAPKVKQKVKIKFKNVFFGTILFLAFFMICYRYSIINEKFLSVNKMKTELSEVQTVNEQIQADIENKTDLKSVESYAKYQLGMQKPSSSQIQYVNVEKEDKIMMPVSIEEDKQESIIEYIIKEIRKILD